MDWDKLRIFHAVADAGSLTHAGDTLHLSQSAVSRQIRALEDSLNTTLFHRHARGLILTEQGELLFDATKSMNKRLEAASARIRDSEEEAFGDLRVTTTTGFGTLWLAPRLPKLYEKYPDLKSNQNFLALQSQLEGTENRISVARRDYIGAIERYNTEMRTYPGKLWHSWLYSELKPRDAYYAATTENAEQAPQVNF